MSDPDPTERFYRLVWPHRTAILRAARVQTGNAAEAEDLAQETLLKAFRSIGAFRDGTEPRAWLYTILRNTRIDRLRMRAGREEHVSLDVLSAEEEASPIDHSGHDSAWTVPNVPEEILSAFSDEQIIHALQAVSEEMRWTLLLVDVEGLDHSEAARILDVPLGTIKSRVHRGHELLRKALLPLARDRRLVRD